MSSYGHNGYLLQHNTIKSLLNSIRARDVEVEKLHQASHLVTAVDLDYSITTVSLNAIQMPKKVFVEC